MYFVFRCCSFFCFVLSPFYTTLSSKVFCNCVIKICKNLVNLHETFTIMVYYKTGFELMVSLSRRFIGPYYLYFAVHYTLVWRKFMWYCFACFWGVWAQQLIAINLKVAMKQKYETIFFCQYAFGFSLFVLFARRLFHLVELILSILLHHCAILILKTCINTLYNYISSEKFVAGIGIYYLSCLIDEL